MSEDRIKEAIDSIKNELDERLQQLREAGKLLEAQRLNARTRFDIEMLQEVGHCPGIENYSRPLSGRPAGIDAGYAVRFLSRRFLLLVDESHVTIPQIRAMFSTATAAAR